MIHIWCNMLDTIRHRILLVIINLSVLNFYQKQKCIRDITSTVETVLWDCISIQGIQLHSGDTNSQMWSQKNVRIIIVSITSIEGIPGYSGKGTCFLGPRTPGYPPFRGHLSSQKVDILNSASRILQC